MVRATIGAPAREDFPLSFNDIIGHVPGRPGRDDAKKGMFQHKNGNILVVYSVNPCLVEIEPRRNGKKTNRTGLTRAGMFIVDAKTGSARLVTCNKDPDGVKEWKEYAGSVTLAGNPHVVDADDADGDED